MMHQSDFPAWSISLYDRGEVAESCLRLQDEYGLDVNAVLFCFWFGAHRGVAGEDLWERIDEISRQWQGCLIRPLREARRWLKHPGFEADREQRELRGRIKQIEIDAELLQQKMMQRVCIEAGIDVSGKTATSDPAAAAKRNAEALLLRRGLALNDELNALLAVICSAAFD